MFPRTGIEPVTIGHMIEYCGPQLFEHVETSWNYYEVFPPTVNIQGQDSACIVLMIYILLYCIIWCVYFHSRCWYLKLYLGNSDLDFRCFGARCPFLSTRFFVVAYGQWFVRFIACLHLLAVHVACPKLYLNVCTSPRLSFCPESQHANATAVCTPCMADVSGSRYLAHKQIFWHPWNIFAACNF